MKVFYIFLNIFTFIWAHSTNSENGYCTANNCPTDESTRTKPINAIDESELFAEKFLKQSTEIMRTSPTFFAHIYQNNSGSLTYNCPAILFMYNSAYIPNYCNLKTSQSYVIKYRCYHRDNLNLLDAENYQIESAPVTKLGYEPYFGIPTSTSLEILVAHFMHNTSLPCDQLSPIGLTSNDPKMDPETEFAVLIGNGYESRRVKYEELNKDGEDLDKNEEF